MYHGAKNKLRLNQTFDCLAWRLFTSTSTSAGKRRNAAATFEKHGSFELSVLQLESIKLELNWSNLRNCLWGTMNEMIEHILTMTMAAKVSTAAPRGKVTDWIRWRVKHKTTWFLYWLMLSNLFRLDVVFVWEVTFWTWMRGVRGLKPCLSATSSTVSSSCSWRCLVNGITYIIYWVSIHNFNTKE